MTEVFHEKLDLTILRVVRLMSIPVLVICPTFPIGAFRSFQASPTPRSAGPVLKSSMFEVIFLYRSSVRSILPLAKPRSTPPLYVMTDSQPRSGLAIPAMKLVEAVPTCPNPTGPGQKLTFEVYGGFGAPPGRFWLPTDPAPSLTFI